VSTLEQDIEKVRGVAVLAWQRGDLMSWWLASCVLLAWRLAYRAGVR
jgi:hypothetical protein